VELVVILEMVEKVTMVEPRTPMEQVAVVEAVSQPIRQAAVVVWEFSGRGLTDLNLQSQDNKEAEVPAVVVVQSVRMAHYMAEAGAKINQPGLMSEGVEPLELFGQVERASHARSRQPIQEICDYEMFHQNKRWSASRSSNA
jgi:hypothetical protein